jgi:hypothetical protein
VQEASGEAQVQAFEIDKDEQVEYCTHKTQKDNGAFSGVLSRVKKETNEVK